MSPIDGERLRAVMRRVPTPVTVVTARHGEAVRGMTVGSFTSVSLVPPLVCFNVAHAAQMHPVLLSGPHFNVHVLTAEQAALSDRFARPEQAAAAQFAGLDYTLDAHGLPVLGGVLAVLHCRRHAHFEAGDHTVVVGEVEAITEGEGAPMLYYNRSYRAVGAPVALPFFAAANEASGEMP